MKQHYELRRERIEEIIARGEPAITSQNMLMDMLNEEGWDVQHRDTISSDLTKIGATKVKEPYSGKWRYILATRADVAGEQLAAEQRGRYLMKTHGHKLTELEGLTPVHLSTLGPCGELVAEPFTVWKPYGVEAVMSSRESVIFWVQPTELEQVMVRLNKMLLGHPA